MQRSAKPVSVKRILLLFFTTMVVSLLVLIVLFNLFFKNIDIEFNTRVPEQAPVLQVEDTLNESLPGDEPLPEETTEESEGTAGKDKASVLPKEKAAFQAQNIKHAVVRVPGHSHYRSTASASSKKKMG